MEPSELIQRFEANEIAAWRSIYQSPLPAVAAQLGMGSFEHAGALLMWNRAAPVPILNRLVGIGVFAPADEASIDLLLNRSRAERCPCLVQIAPTAESSAGKFSTARLVRRMRSTYPSRTCAAPDWTRRMSGLILWRTG